MKQNTTLLPEFADYPIYKNSSTETETPQKHRYDYDEASTIFDGSDGSNNPSTHDIDEMNKGEFGDFA